MERSHSRSSKSPPPQQQQQNYLYRDYSEEKLPPPQFRIIEGPLREESLPTESLLDHLQSEARQTNIATSEALEKLRRLREEIEFKHKMEKVEQAKTVNELVLQHKLFQHSLRGLTDDRFNRFAPPTYKSTMVPY
eukprot:CAMPEP_0202979620 /NCGR_PEP_ID=MMETSP1396-20130829/85719_1 /ASSEMBLY_ACC=CAM_ASM_000872 /TAXON_ID= /ORGANISM="Pseudokeronopsis sp., Strain Brazil" /LENGTH=134 /DNA_ID=CAMNT_0049719123 /DNA_START=1157 /DNA_END=1561 /DNA_ORIENTATION=+